MKKISYLLLLAFMVTQCAMANSVPTPAGYWQTIDDVTNKPKSILQISESSDHTYLGKVIKIFPRPGYDENEVCEACGGQRHNQRIVGMVVLESLKANPDDRKSWINGKILDPLNGKTYNCNVTLLDNGNKLNVRGYIGIPLFGRSQTWVKMNHYP